MKRFLLATACNARHADFAAHHWLPSLRDHVDLRDIDVVVFDYGMDENARRAFRAAGVETLEQASAGDICSLRHSALAELLHERQYEQATLVDCGDVIFQRDISGLFAEHGDQFRATCEDVHCDFLSSMMAGTDFHPEVWRGALRDLRDKPMINGSGLIAPRQKWIEFEKAFGDATLSRDRFGTDQAFVNIYLHRVGFVRLDPTYNFSLKTTRRPFTIRESKFYDERGELIAVVHNTGGSSASRAIRSFGYGAGHNRGVRRFGRWATRFIYEMRRRTRS